MHRYVTYETDCGLVVALSELEFSQIESLDAHAAPLSVSDWVWQFAIDKESAIEQHPHKVDSWLKDPSKDTY